MSNNIRLDAEIVWNINGKFKIASYQRGYRWGKDEIERLLDDIYSNGSNNYCLQPIVVKNNIEYYELIDGQQRLTTIYIIFKYIQKEYKPKMKINFSISYDTRNQSADFLKNIANPQLDSNSNIDFFFMNSAYLTVKNWFEHFSNIDLAVDNIFRYLCENVKIIWYEVDSSADAIGLFTRLNIGKIPLTSAELVKAMFLCKDGNKNMDRKKQEEVSLQWDNIERQLQDDRLWYFLSNNMASEYSTRIELLLDLISGKSIDEREKYFTFFYFDKIRDNKNLNEIWNNIQHHFLTVKDWFEDHELYHKIGYLIASKSKSLAEVFLISKGITKSRFRTILDGLIKESIQIDANYGELSYENKDDYQKITKLLLLFNVESVRINGEHTQWFPFDKFKSVNDGNSGWSLEHIHAQQSEGLSKQKDWKEWLRLHRKSVETIVEDNGTLLNEIDGAINEVNLDRTKFEDIQNKVVQNLSLKGSTEYLHSISNLALLSTSDNAALNNSTFDVKRNEIIEMDKKGKFIPFCTKMAFFKYYTDSDVNQLHFWGEADRKAYIDAINQVLSVYLNEPINIDNH